VSEAKADTQELLRRVANLEELVAEALDPADRRPVNGIDAALLLLVFFLGIYVGRLGKLE
jgi:hypothetical protein